MSSRSAAATRRTCAVAAGPESPGPSGGAPGIVGRSRFCSMLFTTSLIRLPGARCPHRAGWCVEGEILRLEDTPPPTGCDF